MTALWLKVVAALLRAPDWLKATAVTGLIVLVAFAVAGGVPSSAIGAEVRDLDTRLHIIEAKTLEAASDREAMNRTLVRIEAKLDQLLLKLIEGR